MIIALDQQHVNQRSRPHDVGAVLKRVGRADIREVDLTGLYVTLARQYLLDAGHTVFTGFFGTYARRHKLVNAFNPTLYIACHFNSGGGRYSLTKVQPHAGTGTFQLAACLADACRRRLGLKKASVRRFQNDSSGKAERGYSTIRRIGRPMAILLEPAFLRDPVLKLKTASALSIHGLMESIAWAICDGIKQWEKDRSPEGDVEGF